MSKYLINKNLIHNGVHYKKHQIVNESIDGFKDLLKMGHISEVPLKDLIEEKVEEKAEEKPAANKKK